MPRLIKVPGFPDLTGRVMTIQSIVTGNENRTDVKNGNKPPFSAGANDILRLRNKESGQLTFSDMCRSSDDISSVHFPNEAVQFWKIYFDFAYFTLLSPFRFNWKSDTGFYECHSSIIQRALQWLLSFSTSFFYVFKLNQMWRSDPIKNPTLFFDMAYYFFDTIVLVIIFLWFGTKKPLVARVFQELQLNNGKFYNDAINYKKTRGIGALILIGCLGTLGLQILETFLNQSWNFNDFISFWKNEATTVFGCPSMTEAAPILFGSLALISSLFEKLLDAFSDILFTMTVLLFNSFVNSFEADIIKARRLKEFHSTNRVLEHYWWVKYITTKINVAMSLITGAFIAGNLPFYATNVFEIFGDGNVFMRIRFLFYCTYWFPSLFIAANASYKVQKVKGFICQEQYYDKVPLLKLQVFLHEVDFYSVGISSYGIITVTWQSVGSIISVILTYALLKSQFKTNTKIEDTDFEKVLLEIKQLMTNATAQPHTE